MLAQQVFNKGYYKIPLQSAFFCALPTSDGNYILGGNNFGGGGDTLIFIKINPQGEILWITKKDFTPDGGDDIYNAIELIDGYLFSGAGSDRNRQLYPPNAEPYLLKIDLQGNFLWGKYYGSPYLNDGFKKVKQTTDGGFIAVGTTALIINKKVQPTDAYVVKLDKDYNVQWERKFGGYDNDEANDIIVTEDGNYLFCGYALSYRAPQSGPAWIMKINSNGDSLWQQTPGGLGAHSFNSMDSDKNGGYIFAGQEVYNPPGNANYKGYVLKTDLAGNQSWSNIYDYSSKYDQFVRVKQLSDGNYILAGNANDTSRLRAGFSPDEAACPSALLTKIAPDGKQIWQKLYRYGNDSRIQDQYMIDMCLTPDNGVLFCGYMFSPNQSWLVKVDSSGCADTLCLIKNSLGAWPDRNKEVKGFRVYPNPNGGLFNLHYPFLGLEAACFEIYTIDGRLLSSQPLSAGRQEEQFFENHLKAGVYLWRVRSATRILAQDRLMILPGIND